MGPPRLLPAILVFPCYFLIIFASDAFAVTDATSESQPSPPAPWNVTFTDTLKRSLLAGYDKFARPSHHQVATNVSLGLNFYHVELDDAAAVMTLHGWIKMAWFDEKLTWNASDYGGLQNLHLADHEIWQPDVVQYNSASGSTVDQYGNTHCMVSDQGAVFWVPPTKLTTFCNLDLSRWPEDEHTCYYVFGSWTYDGIQISLTGSQEAEMDSIIESDHYIENAEWQLVNVSIDRLEKYYACCGDAPYHSIEYGVVIRRRGGSRAMLLRLQAMAAVLLALLTHWLPPTKAAPKALLSAAPPTIIVLALFYLAQRLPPTAHSPNIVMLYSGCLYLCCGSAIVSVCVLNLCRSKRTLPWSVRRALTSKPLRWIAPSSALQHDSSASEELQSASAAEGMESSTIPDTFKSPPAPAWLALATVIDRIAFIIFLLIFFILLAIYGF